LLDRTDAGGGTPVAVAAALANLDEDQGAIGLAHDQINLAAAAAGRAKIRV
jgi:hypothetical protein